MIDAVEAREVARKYIEAIEPSVGAELMLFDESTIERAVGWMFFYQTREFVETGIWSSALVGNAPLIVNRGSAELVVTGTAKSPVYYFDKYEAELSGEV
jgi:hypothetical protein